jgi:outer membrane biosynthesis protein TonB
MRDYTQTGKRGCRPDYISSGRDVGESVRRQAGRKGNKSVWVPWTDDNTGEVVDVDEEMIRDVMREVPAGRNRQPVKVETAAPESGTIPEKPTPTAQIVPTAQGELEPEPAQALPAMHTEPKESESAKRGQYRKKRPQEEDLSYRDRFLVNDGICSRVSTYINRDAHEKIKRLLSSAAPNISIVSYINNIVVHHLEQYQEEITELYRNGMDKPF